MRFETKPLFAVILYTPSSVPVMAFTVLVESIITVLQLMLEPPVKGIFDHVVPLSVVLERPATVATQAVERLYISTTRSLTEFPMVRLVG